MIRSLYLTALLVLQLAIIIKFAPALAQALRVDAIPPMAPAGWPTVLQSVATSVAVAGAALSLAFPVVAAARHGRAGPHRFLGLPRWAVALALTGASLLAASTLLFALAPMLAGEDRMIALPLARSGVAGGLAVAMAGVLCAELLRRSVAAGRTLLPGARLTSGRIEVTYPPELRTRTLATPQVERTGR